MNLCDPLSAYLPIFKLELTNVYFYVLANPFVQIDLMTAIHSSCWCNSLILLSLFLSFLFILFPCFLLVQLAQKELQKINMYKAPRDKLSCILNCCKVINNLLLNASIVSNDNPPGADEFLPVLIYVTIKVWLIAFA